MGKQRTLRELRQTKDSVYRHPIEPKDFEFVTHRFTETRLIKYITDCFSKVNGVVNEIDVKIIEDYIKNNK